MKPHIYIEKSSSIAVKFSIEDNHFYATSFIYHENKDKIELLKEGNIIDFHIDDTSLIYMNDRCLSDYKDVSEDYLEYKLYNFYFNSRYKAYYSLMCEFINEYVNSK